MRVVVSVKSTVERRSRYIAVESTVEAVPAARLPTILAGPMASFVLRSPASVTESYCGGTGGAPDVLTLPPALRRSPRVDLLEKACGPAKDASADAPGVASPTTGTLAHPLR